MFLFSSSASVSALGAPPRALAAELRRVDLRRPPPCAGRPAAAGCGRGAAAAGARRRRRGRVALRRLARAGPGPPRARAGSGRGTARPGARRRRSIRRSELGSSIGLPAATRAVLDLLGLVEEPLDLQLGLLGVAGVVALVPDADAHLEEADGVRVAEVEVLHARLDQRGHDRQLAAAGPRASACLAIQAAISACGASSPG